jgi:hypothetical protein
MMSVVFDIVCNVLHAFVVSLVVGCLCLGRSNVQLFFGLVEEHGLLNVVEDFAVLVDGVKENRFDPANYGLQEETDYILECIEHSALQNPVEICSVKIPLFEGDALTQPWVTVHVRVDDVNCPLVRVFGVHGCESEGRRRYLAAFHLLCMHMVLVGRVSLQNKYDPYFMPVDQADPGTTLLDRMTIRRDTCKFNFRDRRLRNCANFRWKYVFQGDVGGWVEFSIGPSKDQRIGA